jgi:hypothetical protein
MEFRNKLISLNYFKSQLKQASRRDTFELSPNRSPVQLDRYQLPEGYLGSNSRPINS